MSRLSRVRTPAVQLGALALALGASAVAAQSGRPDPARLDSIAGAGVRENRAMGLVACRYIGHGGTAPGFRADATGYPDAQMAVVVLMNASPASSRGRCFRCRVRR